MPRTPPYNAKQIVTSGCPVRCLKRPQGACCTLSVSFTIWVYPTRCLACPAPWTEKFSWHGSCWKGRVSLSGNKKSSAPIPRAFRLLGCNNGFRHTSQSFCFIYFFSCTHTPSHTSITPLVLSSKHFLESLHRSRWGEFFNLHCGFGCSQIWCPHLAPCVGTGVVDAFSPSKNHPPLSNDRPCLVYPLHYR